MWDCDARNARLKASVEEIIAGLRCVLNYHCKQVLTANEEENNGSTNAVVMLVVISVRRYWALVWNSNLF